ncbi:5-aminolevulinate synthase, mitochondrial [Neolecta irregularis DAH-3]|uniref:5-aminolevulinate synthase n=1 Tax=Neolecta irregularis (strain DAH-3) TaxID=1198029 RepID=A0A1U7LWQ5_NEOID|nr:5-aminolevulinate synthase, mitochondrial [Neolecta irregularis DAH-3]|eukprot:OLL27003.1 5-aminolevulinate synthase, mitochondrial [Neolecta irregularis DAH-3]
MEALVAQGANVCPFLRNATPTTLRILASRPSGVRGFSVLQREGLRCPVLGRSIKLQMIHRGYIAPCMTVKMRSSPQFNAAMIQRGYVAPCMNAKMRYSPHINAAATSLESVHLKAKIDSSRGGVCPHMVAVQNAGRAARRGSPTLFPGSISCPINQSAQCPVNRLTPINHSTQSSPFDYDGFYQSELDKKHLDKSYRYFNNINRLAKEFPRAHTRDPLERVDVWSANDYLGMSRHPKVIEAIHATVDKYGAGSGGTRNISGNFQLVELLEASIARLHQKEAALVFSSCYVANDATLSTLGAKMPGCVILSDQLNHASMIQGIRHSGAVKMVFRHNDLCDLEAKLQTIPAGTPKIIAFESVYSMCGSVSDINAVCDLAEKYGALTFLDEVHSVGLYNYDGAGVAAHLDTLSKHSRRRLEAPRGSAAARIDIVSGTLGKAYGNVGGYICGSARLVDCVRSLAPGFIFTTSLPPHVMAGARAAIEHQRTTAHDRIRQQLNVRRLKSQLARLDIPVVPNPSHILPLLVGDAATAKAASDDLLHSHAIYVQGINYPTVPVGHERLRITPSPHHTPEITDKLVHALDLVWKKFNIRRSADWAAIGGRAGVGHGSKEIVPLWTDDMLGIKTCKSDIIDTQLPLHSWVSL